MRKVSFCLASTSFTPTISSRIACRARPSPDSTAASKHSFSAAASLSTGGGRSAAASSSMAFFCRPFRLLMVVVSSSAVPSLPLPPAPSRAREPGIEPRERMRYTGMTTVRRASPSIRGSDRLTDRTTGCSRLPRSIRYARELEESDHLDGRKPRSHAGHELRVVDLIYLDPPFNSKANYAAPIGARPLAPRSRTPGHYATWMLNG